MNRKKRILFIGEAVALAHVTRPLVLAKSLDPQQYDIHFACDPRYQFLLSGSPHIQYWPIRSIPSKTFVKAASRGKYAYKKSDLESYLDQELTLFKRIRPSLIIGDLRCTLSTSAKLSHIPHAVLANVCWSPYRAIEAPPVLEFSAGGSIGRRIVAKLAPWAQPFLEKASLTYLNSIRDRFRLPPLKNNTDLLTRADYTLYAEPSDFIQTTPMPSHHIFLGPILWSPDSPRPSWWQTWNPKLPLIYVTLGSSGAIRKLPEIVRTLAELPMTVVVATAGRAQLKRMPQNVYVADYLPGMEICRLASVVVCSGGSATAYQGLSQGAPVVGIWSNWDQYVTIAAIERAGAGLGCSGPRLDLRKLRDIISSVLEDPRYQARARELAERFRSYDACQRFRQFVHQATGNESSASQEKLFCR